MSGLSIDGWSRRVVPYVIAILASVATGLTLHAALIDRPVTAFAVSLFVFVTLLVCAAMRELRRTLRSERGHRNEAERALRQTRALEALTRELSKSQTVAEVTQACLSELLPAAGAVAGAVALVSDDERQLGVVQAMGYANCEAARLYTVMLASKTVLTEVVRRQTPLTFVSQEDRGGRFPDLSFDAPLDDGEGAIVMPLIVSGRAIGVVALSYQQPLSSDSDERSFLMGQDRTAQALDRAMRYEHAERARADLEAYRTQADIEIRERQRAEDALRESEARYRALAARTTRLYTLSAGLSEAVTLDAVAKVIVREGKVVAGASAGSVTLLDGAQFETLYAEEYPRQLVEAWHRFPAERACARRRPSRPVVRCSSDPLEWQQQFARSASMAADGGYASAPRASSSRFAHWCAVVPLHGAGEFRRPVPGAAHVRCASRRTSDRSCPVVRSGAARAG
jgi:K+-sensing histidine kinase KdpD